MAADAMISRFSRNAKGWLGRCAASALLASNLAGCGGKPGAKAQAAELERSFTGAPTNSFVGLALTAIRGGDYPAGVIALQAAKAAPGMTPEQLMAVQGTMQSITAELAARADKGDPQAKADLAIIERSRSQ